MFGISAIRIRGIASILAFSLFFIQFNIYDSLNTKISELEICGMRYDITANGSHLTKLLFNQDSNPQILRNSASALTNSLLSTMIKINFTFKEQENYLTNLARFNNNKITGLKTYNSFINEYNKIVNRFLINEYQPRVEKFKIQKAYCRWSIIVLTGLLILFNLYLELTKKD